MTAELDFLSPTTTPDSWAPIRFTDAPDAPPLQPVLGDTRLLYPGKRHVFSGPPESAKTLAAYAILILIARTGKLGVLIDFEMGVADAKTRLRELGATSEELERLYYIGPDEKATTLRIGALLSLQPDLIVIDAAAGAYQLEGLDENKRADVETFSNLYIAPFWRADIATLTIDHVVKNSETRGRFQIGSERKLGATDIHLGFDTITPISRGTNGRYKITTHKDRVGALKRGHIADLTLESDPDTHQITWTFTAAQTATSDTGYFRPTHVMEKVSIYLETQPEPVTRNAVHEALGGKKAIVFAAIHALISEGFAATTTASNGAKPVKSVRRYRENDPDCEPGGSLSQGTTETYCGSRVVPSNHAVVPGGSRVVPDAQTSGGSRWSTALLRSADHGTTDETSKTDVWFDNNGNLSESELAAWQDDLAANLDPDDDLFAP